MERSPEGEPDTTNVAYMDEYRRAKWMSELNRARKAGGVATFGAMHDDPAEVIPFPRKPDDEPDPAA